MNFRRQPFQFTAIDPAKRQAELQKRFGLPTNNSDMLVDFINPNIMGSGIKEPSLTSGSPRLQHRVPVFSENAEKVRSEQNNVDGSHKPRVRVVPIQLEGVDTGKRHCTHSGPAGLLDECNNIHTNGKLQETFSHLNTPKVGEKVKQSGPRVCNIPVQIEPREKQHETEKVKVEQPSQTFEPAKKMKPELNGCAASSGKEPKSLSLKQIEKVLNKLNEYKEKVEKFSGTSKDKQYRYLDEMLTRCMLDLDNVETMGLDEIRKARKEAVRQVQHYVDLLDTKVNMDAEKIDSDLTRIVDSTDESKESDIPVDSDVSTSAKNELVESKVATTSNVEMMDSDLVADSVEQFKESAEKISANSNDVEMTEARTLVDAMEESANKGKNVSSQDKPIGNVTESLDGSNIVIEELDNSESESNNVIETDNVQCIVSHSPELGGIETIAEEGDSEIIIEEVDCGDGVQNIRDHSSNSCDGDNDKKLTEQLSVKDDHCSATSPITEPIVQETLGSEKL